jgi:hypothetical protein
LNISFIRELQKNKKKEKKKKRGKKREREDEKEKGKKGIYFPGAKTIINNPVSQSVRFVFTFFTFQFC